MSEKCISAVVLLYTREVCLFSVFPLHRKDVSVMATHTDKTHFLIIFIHSYFLSLSHIYTCTQIADNTDALLPLWLCCALHSYQHLKHKNSTQLNTDTELTDHIWLLTLKPETLVEVLGGWIHGCLSRNCSGANTELTNCYFHICVRVQVKKTTYTV